MPHPLFMLSAISDDVHPYYRRSSIAASGLLGRGTDVEITLDDQQPGTFVPSYTTLEKIQGTASITTPVDLPFDDVNITFTGSVKTFVEKLATSSPTIPRTQAFHNFLRLAQPINPSDLPENKIAKAGVTYRFPFTFVVPERLLPQACSHDLASDAVREAHLALPPSLGDPMMAGGSKTLLDDLAPDNAMVSYNLRVSIIRKAVEPETRAKVLVDKVKKLRIIPASEESAPLGVLGGKEDDYELRKSKSVKKGVFNKEKTGTLTVEASQPKSVHLHGLRSTETSPASTMATLNLRFDPYSATAKPPKLQCLVSKLKVSTFYSSVPLTTFPMKATQFQFDAQRGAFLTFVSLANRCIEQAKWTMNKPSPRRDSAVSVGSAASSGSSNSIAPSPDADLMLPYYTAQVLVPISLPTKKTFVPTFHTCLISRVYTLDLAVSAHSAPTIHLKLPLEITAEGNADARPVISPEEAASIARREAEGMFAPRSVAPPSELAEQWDGLRGVRGSIFTARGNSVSSQAILEDDDAAPPGYTPLGRSTRVAIVEG